MSLTYQNIKSGFKPNNDDDDGVDVGVGNDEDQGRKSNRITMTLIVAMEIKCKE